MISPNLCCWCIILVYPPSNPQVAYYWVWLPTPLHWYPISLYYTKGTKVAPSIKCLNHYNIFKGFPKYLSNIQSIEFLALLDYVGSLESSWNQNSSIGRPSHGGIDYLWTYCIKFFQTLVVASPEPYLFWNLENQSIIRFVLRHSTTVLMAQKTKVCGFFTIFFFFVNMGPYGSKNFKALLLPQITFESFRTFPEFTIYCLGCLKFWVPNF